MRGSTATGSSGKFQPRRIVPSAARAAPGWPSICVYAAASARRASTNIARQQRERQAEQQRVEPRAPQDADESATARTPTNTPSMSQVTAGSALRVIR